MSVPALCCTCQSVATASLDKKWRDQQVEESQFDIDCDVSMIYLMDDHDFVMSNGVILQQRCKGSGTTPQTIRIR